MSFSGQVALITGGARGIGQATAVELARHGADIAVCDLNAADETVRLVELCGRRARAFQIDVGDRNAVEALFASLLEEWGRLDILVNNAAANIRKPLVDLDVADVEKVWHVSLWGVFHCSQLAARQMVRQGSGSIIVISSVHAERPYANSTAYNGAKAAVSHMARTWAGELVRHGVRVNVIEPGWTDTPGERSFFTEEQIREEGRKLPMGRLGTPEEIAKAVRYLASEDASYVTGTSLRVDGGLLLPR